MDLFIRNCDHIENLLAGNEPLSDTVARLILLGDAMRDAVGLGVVDGPMYQGDDDAECVYRLLGVDSVEQRRRTAGELAGLALTSPHITDDELLALMNTCNVARMTFARHLGSFDPADATPLSGDVRTALDGGFQILSVVVDQAARVLSAL